MEAGIAILLHIAFQDGFDDDTVVARLDGREVYRGQGLSTDYRIGVAASFELEVEAGRKAIEIDLPLKHIGGSLEIDITAPAYLAVSTTGTELSFRVAHRRFGYA